MALVNDKCLNIMVVVTRGGDPKHTYLMIGHIIMSYYIYQ